MREQNFGQRFLPFHRVVRSEVDTRIGEGLIGRGKDRERPDALQGFQQLGLNNRSHKGIVNTRALRRAWNVVGMVNGHQDRVDDVDDAVAGHHVRDGNGCAVDRHGVAHAERQRMAANRFGGHAVDHVR